MTKRQKVYWENLELSSKPEEDPISLGTDGEKDEESVEAEVENNDKASK